MNIEEYSALALRTANLDKDPLTHATMGICGEGGEIADVVKKHVFYGKNLDKQHLLEEAGDLLWYVNLLIHATGSDWPTVLAANIAKLEARYPNLRFDAAQAISQNKEAETTALNQVL